MRDSINTAINTLPSPTWNKLGVNDAGERARLFEPHPGAKAALTAGPLPAGVYSAGNTPDALYTEPVSGMGVTLDDFVLEHANARHFITAQGTAAEPLVLTGVLDEAHPQLIFQNGIRAMPGSSVTVVELYRSAPRLAGELATLTQIYAGRGANVRLVQVNLAGESCRCWNAVAIKTEPDAKVELIRASLGGQEAYAGARAVLTGARSEFWLDQIYFGNAARVLDFNDVAEHEGEQTLAEMHTAGVLTDRCDKILRGTIDFKKGAVRSVGHESETVLLLSDTARNRTTPLILCGEEQVEGQHAATIGRMNQAQIYYLCSRGLSYAEARRMLVEAQFAPALDKIPDEALRQEILTCVRGRLNENEGCSQ